jgi:hypothetical protein
MMGWIKQKRERHNRLYSCDINLGNEMTVKQSLKVYTLPMVIAACAAVFLHHHLDNKIPPTEQVMLGQERPVLRQLFVEARTHDGRAMSLTVNGRQVKNTEITGWCELAWIGKIQSLVNFTGTVEVGGQTMVDSFVNRSEQGMLDEIQYDLQGRTIESNACVFDILTVDVRER